MIPPTLVSNLTAFPKIASPAAAAAGSSSSTATKPPMDPGSANTAPSTRNSSHHSHLGTSGSESPLPPQLQPSASSSGRLGHTPITTASTLATSDARIDAMSSSLLSGSFKDDDLTETTSKDQRSRPKRSAMVRGTASAELDAVTKRAGTNRSTAGSRASAHTPAEEKKQDDDEDDTTTVDEVEDSNKLTPSASSSFRPRAPGGAMAKLMLLGPKPTEDERTSTSYSEGTKSDQAEESEVEDTLREIEITMKRAKEEFEKGREGNRRYQAPEPEEDMNMEEKISFASSFGAGQGPAFLNRSEIFYETAAAAISALLNPRERAAGWSSSAVHSNSLAPVTSGDSYVSGKISAVGTMSSFAAPAPKGEKHLPSVFTTPDGSGGPIRQSDSYHSFGRRDVSDHLITPETEKKLEAVKSKMHDPNKTLADLLLAIATPEDRDEMDLGFMVRRKNACGALKVLTNDPKKRVRICWTVGVLPALTSVLADIGEDGLTLTFPDRRIRNEYEAARDRAIVALLNLATPKENRIPIFHTPNLIWALLKIILEDKGTARKGCTAILAYLSKSVDNRLLLAQVPGFYDAVVSVLRPMPVRLEPAPRPKDCVVAKKSYHWEEGSESGTEASNRMRSASSEEVADVETDSEKTPKIVASISPVELSGYDETADELLRASRQNFFALLGHLVKEKDNAYHFARHSAFLNTLIDISNFQESPSHTFSVKLLANLTRHRMNSKVMVFQERRTVPALVHGANSENDETRLYACYAIQNLAQEKSCRQELAMIENLVPTLCSRGRFSTAEDERLAAISALKNLCDEPANLIPLTNTPECISTLMHLAHGKEEGVTETMQYRACDALATLSHWLRKIATSGKSLDDMQNGRTPDKKLFVPSLRVVTWNQWQ